MTEMALTADQYDAAPEIGPSKWRLVAITRTHTACDHCGRRIVNAYTVIDPAGNTRTLGRTHVKAATGWNLAQHEAAAMLRCAVDAIGRAAGWAAFAAAHPDQAATITEDINAWRRQWSARMGARLVLATVEWDGYTSGEGQACEARTWIGEGRTYMAARYLADRQTY